MKQVISLAQLQAAMQQYNCTAEHVLASYDCPEYVAQQAAQQSTQVNVGVLGAGAAGAAFDLMAFAAAAPVSASGERRTPAWEATIEELRSRVIIRDVQTPNKKDEANAKLRIQLAPQYVDLAAYGTAPDGGKLVHFIVPRAYQAQAEAKLLADVQAGMHDAALKEAAEKCRLSAEKKKANKAKKAPVDAAAAAAALQALEAGIGGGVALEQPQVAPVTQEPTLDLGLGGVVMPTL